MTRISRNRDFDALRLCHISDRRLIKICYVVSLVFLDKLTQSAGVSALL